MAIFFVYHLDKSDLKELNRKNTTTGLKMVACLLLFLLAFAKAPVAQEFEVGLAGGGMYYLGDLNPGGHFKNLHPAYGGLIRYNINDRWTVRAMAMLGTVSGSTGNSDYLPGRNLSFESPVTDISALVEFNFFDYFTGSFRHWGTPFIYGGAGVTFFNPMAGGQELQPLGTEGQNIGYEGRKPYSLTRFNFPFGLGGKFSLGKRLCVTAFWEMHKLFSDYLDDVSTTYYLDGPSINPDDPAQILSDPTMSYEPGMKRGNATTSDWYSVTGITITYKFALGNTKRCRDLKSQQ